MAMFIMAANAAGIIGGQLFQSSDSPAYKVGWTVIVCLVAVGLVSSLIAIGQYWFENKRILKSQYVNAEDMTENPLEQKRLYNW